MTEMDMKELKRMASNLGPRHDRTCFHGGAGVSDASGIETWRIIHQKYHQKCSPSYPAMALTDLMRVMSPWTAKKHRELIAKIEESCRS